jgi:hypothetical protein
MRSRFPSTTFADTLTVSPVLISGRSLFIWALVSVRIRSIINLRGGRQNLSARAVRIAQPPVGLALRALAPLGGLREVRALSLGAAECLLASPGRNPGMVPREEDLRDTHASELSGSGELRVFKELARERLLGERRGINRARDEAQDRVTKDDRCWLPTGEDEVADAQFQVDIGADTVIHPLIAPADDDQV